MNNMHDIFRDYSLYVAIVLAVTLFGYVIGKGIKKKLENRRIRRGGKPATARVISLARGAWTRTTNNLVELEVILQVEVDYSGHPTFQTEIAAMIPELDIPQVQPGAVLDVLVDPKDPHKAVLGTVTEKPRMTAETLFVMTLLYLAIFLGGVVPLVMAFML